MASIRLGFVVLSLAATAGCGFIGAPERASDTQNLNAISDDDVKYRLKVDLPRLMRRTAMLNRAIFWAVISSVIVTIMVIGSFVAAFL